MPKLAANLTMMFNEVPFLDRFQAAANAGFKGVEYLFPYDYPAEQVKERLERHRLTQVLFDFPAGNWAAGERGIAVDPARRAEFEAGVAKAIDYAKVLDCKLLTVLAGKLPAGVSREQATQTIVSNVGFAARAASAIGASVLVEAINTRDIPGFAVSKTLDARAIVEASGEKNARVQYDVYHMQVMEGDLANTIQHNLGQIAHFQIADNPGRNEPGTGEINYGFILPYIDSLGYRGWVGCEYRPKGKTLDGLGWATNYL